MPADKHLLLINPWIYDFTACDFWLRPLGLLYLAAIIREHTTFQVNFLDFLDSTRVESYPGFRPRLRPDGRASFYKEEVPKPDIFRHIPRKFSRYGWPLDVAEESLKRLPTPEAVLLTCTMTYWYPGVQAAVELVRKIFGRVPVILGGIYASLCPEHAARESGADLVVAGPGENRIFSLLEEIWGHSLLKPIMENGFFSGLDSLPTPAYDLYQDRSVVCLLTSRGCPFNCNYCASRLLQPQFEQRSPDKVVSEIIHLHRLGARQIAFYDDALLLNKEQHLEKILDRIISLRPGLNFHTPNGLSPRAIDYGLAVRLRQAGFTSLFLSLENADPTWLQETGPKVSPADLERALTFLERAGYRRDEISVYLLVGHPSQTREHVLDSLRLVKKLGARPRLAYYSPVPGTVDWQRLLESGQVRADSDPLLHNKLVFPYFWGRISPGDLEEIKRECREG
ncbi:MAG: B12-binding domain-containing radical SAM protein [Candidatus Saccharicenans sp.]|uniref:B12-binding domain-containing radical SAM protein n=1 Tax=Candidatus Saccharicenans sp. TaxID=2819258 RepID=UPI00404A9D51